MHHSAERLDTFGAFWFSPLDMIGWTVAFSLALTLMVGFTPEAATLVLLARPSRYFQHSNVRTPRWLGYLVQRPESHSSITGVACTRQLFRPADLRSPLRHVPQPARVRSAGFYDGASARVADMLLSRRLCRIAAIGSTA